MNKTKDMAMNQSLLSSERMWHFNKIHLSLVTFSFTAFVVFFGIDSFDDAKWVSKMNVSTPHYSLNHQRIQKKHSGSTLSSYKVYI